MKKNHKIQDDLKNIAFKNFLSYDEIAYHSNLSKNTVNNLINKENFNPTLGTLEKISFACGQDCIKLCYLNGPFRNCIIRKITRHILLEDKISAKKGFDELVKIIEALQFSEEDYYKFLYYKKYEKIFRFYFDQVEKEKINFDKLKEDFKKTFGFELKNNLKERPDYFKRDSIYFAGLILARNGHIDIASQIFKKLLTIDIRDDNYLISLISLAKCKLQLKSYRAVISICDDAISICVNNNFSFDMLEILKIRDEATKKLYQLEFENSFKKSRENLLRS
ncbi:hypothetical protein [Lagierella sp.]|uniref:hypothetical protein n=1 Tax=Lagierella sp. TaxID=2849657 RepID=UPI002604A8C7|nr:hypothetical protein [Lagierella sp.]